MIEFCHKEDLWSLYSTIACHENVENWKESLKPYFEDQLYVFVDSLQCDAYLMKQRSALMDSIVEDKLVPVDKGMAPVKEFLVKVIKNLMESLERNDHIEVLKTYLEQLEPSAGHSGN